MDFVAAPQKRHQNISTVPWWWDPVQAVSSTSSVLTEWAWTEL